MADGDFGSRQTLSRNFPCPAVGGMEISERGCGQITANPDRNRRCCVGMDCQSPWRIDIGTGDRIHRDRRPTVVAEAPTEVPAEIIPALEAPMPPVEVPVLVDVATSELEAPPTVEVGVVEVVQVTATPEPAPLEVAPDKDVPVLAKAVGRIVLVDPKRVRRLEGQPREEFDEGELQSLARSVKKRQLNPVHLVVLEGDPDYDYQIIDGERRKIVCERLGKLLLGVIYDDTPLKEAVEQYEASVGSNFLRSNHSPIEIAKAAEKLLKAGRTRTEIGDVLGMHPVTIDHYRKLLRLAPDVQRRMRRDIPPEEQLQLGTAQLLIGFPEEFQVLVAKEVVEQKIDYRQAARHVRTRAVEEGVARRDARQRLRPIEPGTVSRDMLRHLRHIDETLNRMENPAGVELQVVVAARDTDHRQEVRSTLLSMRAHIDGILGAIEAVEPQRIAAE